MSGKYIYNKKTHRLHIEGYCQYVTKTSERIVFKTMDEAYAYDGESVSVCKVCAKKRDQELGRKKS